MSALQTRQQTIRAILTAQQTFPLRTNALSLLSNLAPIKKVEPQRNPTVIEGTSLAPYIGAWEKFQPVLNYAQYAQYKKAAALLRGSPSPTAAQVEHFSIWLAGHQGGEEFATRTGLFLSAMVNGGKGRNFTVHTSVLDDPPNFLGTKLWKNLTVNGNIGEFGAASMRLGKMRINGNAGDYLCSSKKFGSVHVEGNAGDNAGKDMLFGKLIIDGDCGEKAGENNGGIIHVKGAFKSLGFAHTYGAFFQNGNALRMGDILVTATVPGIFPSIAYMLLVFATGIIPLGAPSLLPTAAVVASVVAGTLTAYAAIYSYRYSWCKLYKMLHKEKEAKQ